MSIAHLNTTRMSAPVKTMTPKQESFIRSLMTDFFGPDNAPESWNAWMERNDGIITAKQASEMIDNLIRMKRYAAESTKAAQARGEETAKPATVEAGYYRVDGTVYKVVPNRDGNRFYAKRLVVGEKGTWEYAPGAMRDITPAHAMTLEEAKDFGRTHGFCVACGALLTDPESIAQGIGPVCATKF